LSQTVESNLSRINDRHRLAVQRLFTNYLRVEWELVAAMYCSNAPLYSSDVLFCFYFIHEKLAIAVHVLQNTYDIVSFHVVVLQRTAKKCTKIQNARAEPLFCSINLLFGDVLVAVTVVLC